MKPPICAENASLSAKVILVHLSINAGLLFALCAAEILRKSSLSDCCFVVRLRHGFYAA